MIIQFEQKWSCSNIHRESDRNVAESINVFLLIYKVDYIQVSLYKVNKHSRSQAFFSDHQKSRITKEGYKFCLKIKPIFKILSTFFHLSRREKFLLSKILEFQRCFSEFIILTQSVSAILFVTIYRSQKSYECLTPVERNKFENTITTFICWLAPNIFLKRLIFNALIQFVIINYKTT